MNSNMFDMDPDMDGDEEQQSAVNVPNTIDDTEDDDLPFIPMLDKKPKAAALTEAPGVVAPAPKRDPQEPPDNNAVRNIMDKINIISGQPTINPKLTLNIAQVKSTLNQAIAALSNSECWLPEGKKHHSDKMDKVGEAIAKALSSFVSHLEKME